ncbi:MAG: DUF2225 domain-containing protein [Defluviitaleaceae bacterium]|nr:DUF2225 domain-containing protein [Defluviitaleaceae bacterium]
MNIELLKGNAHSKKFPAGQIIIGEGDDMGNEMYVILEGQVAVFKNFKMPGETRLADLGPGNFLGEMGLFLNKKRTATVIAKVDVVALAIGRDAAFNFFETQPQLTYSVIKTLCQRLDNANKSLSRGDVPSGLAEGTPSELLFEPPAPVAKATPPAPVAKATPPAPAASTAPAASAAAPMMFSDNPTPEQMAAYMEAQSGATAAPAAPSSLPGGIFPEGHKIYDLPINPAPSELVYKKTFKCPICEKSFPSYSVRNTRLKLIERKRDFRSIYQDIDTTHYEIITCPECYFSNFDSAYAQPVISRFKENIPQITAFKNQLKVNLDETREINAVFAGYYLALKGAPLFYKSYEMFAAKIWLRLMWLYHDVGDEAMEEMTCKEAHSAYLAAFEKTDASPEAIQQLCVLMGELSILVNDLPSAKLFFVKARTNRNGSKVLLTQAEDGIERIRKIEASQAAQS